MGFPIRRSTDQRLFAPSRSLSQRTTSFLASYRQGIHQMPLGHLIALISNAHHGRKKSQRPGDGAPSLNQPSAKVSIVERPEFIRIDPAPKLQSAALAHNTLQPQPFHIDPPCDEPMLSGDADYSASQAYPLFTMSRTPPELIRAELLSSTWMLSAFDARRNGGASRPRTDDLKLAKLALSQLSYGPNPIGFDQRFARRRFFPASPRALHPECGGPGKI